MLVQEEVVMITSNLQLYYIRLLLTLHLTSMVMRLLLINCWLFDHNLEGNSLS